MSRAIAVLRPEPGNRVTAAAIEARGRRAVRLPLFEVVPIRWDVPDPVAFDALILTSANAVRHGGTGLHALRLLPVYAVGDATAQAARRAGFVVASTGQAGADSLVAAARAAGVARALHLGGRERTLEAGGIVARALTVYASEPRAVDAAPLAGSVAMVQSARAGARLRDVVLDGGLDRSDIAIAVVSARAAAAAGDGWERVAVAASTHAEALIEAAIALAD